MINEKSIAHRKAKPWKRLLIVAFIMYLGALVVLMLLERTMLFPAPSVQYGYWQADMYGAVEHYVESTGKTKVHVWSFKKTNAAKTLIFCHGNGESLGFLGEELAEIRDRWNVNVVAFDFRGYGKTGGLANEVDILADSVAVAKWIESNDTFRNHQLIAFGRSLGGACAVEIATKTKVSGLILDRTFSSIVDVAADRYFFFPIRLLMRNQFLSIERIPSYTGPLLQMHGDVDELIPYRFGKKLFDACSSPRKKFLTIRGLHHNDSWPEEFWDAGKKFVAEL